MVFPWFSHGEVTHLGIQVRPLMWDVQRHQNRRSEENNREKLWFKHQNLRFNHVFFVGLTRFNQQTWGFYYETYEFKHQTCWSEHHGEFFKWAAIVIQASYMVIGATIIARQATNMLNIGIQPTQMCCLPKKQGELTGTNGLMQTKHAHTHTGVQVGFNVSPSWPSVKSWEPCSSYIQYRHIGMLYLKIGLFQKSPK